MLVSRVSLIKVDLYAIRIVVPVNDGVTNIPTDFPGRSGNTLELILCFDTQRIADWPTDYGSARCFVKAANKGVYQLLNVRGDVESALVGEYVPECLPNFGGNYLEMDIEADGTVNGWIPSPEKIAEAFSWVIR